MNQEKTTSKYVLAAFGILIAAFAPALLVRVSIPLDIARALAISCGLLVLLLGTQRPIHTKAKWLTLFAVAILSGILGYVISHFVR